MSIKLRKNFLKSDLNFRERQTPQMDLIVPAARNESETRPNNVEHLVLKPFEVPKENYQQIVNERIS